MQIGHEEFLIVFMKKDLTIINMEELIETLNREIIRLREELSKPRPRKPKTEKDK